MTRKKGKVVLVGVSGMEIKRKIYTRKNSTFLSLHPMAQVDTTRSMKKEG